jgi:hypothetical protein
VRVVEGSVWSSGRSPAADAGRWRTRFRRDPASSAVRWQGPLYRGHTGERKAAWVRALRLPGADTARGRAPASDRGGEMNRPGVSGDSLV